MSVVCAQTDLRLVVIVFGECCRRGFCLCNNRTWSVSNKYSQHEQWGLGQIHRHQSDIIRYTTERHVKYIGVEWPNSTRTATIVAFASLKQMCLPSTTGRSPASILHKNLGKYTCYVPEKHTHNVNTHTCKNDEFFQPLHVEWGARGGGTVMWR